MKKIGKIFSHEKLNVQTFGDNSASFAEYAYNIVVTALDNCQPFERMLRFIQVLAFDCLKIETKKKNGPSKIQVRFRAYSLSIDHLNSNQLFRLLCSDT